MSRVFSGANYLLLNTAYPVAPPFTMSCWVKRTANLAAANVMNLGINTSDNRYSLSCDTADNVLAIERDTTAAQGTATQVFTTNIWQLWTGVFISHSSRSAFLNGANKGANATTKAAPNGTMIVVGARADLSVGMVGNLAHAAIWDIDLSDSDVANLMTMDPRLIQSNHLAHYWPLNGNQSPEPDYGFRGEPITVTGPTYSTDEPTPLIWIQEAGVITRVERGVAG